MDEVHESIAASTLCPSLLEAYTCMLSWRATYYGLSLHQCQCYSSTPSITPFPLSAGLWCRRSPRQLAHSKESGALSLRPLLLRLRSLKCLPIGQARLVSYRIFSYLPSQKSCLYRFQSHKAVDRIKFALCSCQLYHSPSGI